MYTIDRYMANIRQLTNSLVIKVNELPMVVNIGVENTIGYDPGKHKPTRANIKTWKYYLNIAGKMHPLDKPIKIRVIETEREEVLTKELLDRYPMTKIELCKMDKFYTNFMNTYPEYQRYIHGCMFPVDIDRAIEAREGTILAYNKDLVEENEYYLIEELETYIKSMLSRYHVKPYTIVDELYVASLMGYLYASIYTKIFNLRLEKIGTFQVHSFHLEHFFRSRMDLWDDVNILNKRSLFWLYKNLDSMMHNVGKESTFKKVYNKLFAMNYVGIGEYTLNRPDPKFHDNKTDVSNPSYVRDSATLVTKQLNNYYLTNNGAEESVISMTSRELTGLDDVNKNMPPVFQKYIEKVTKEETDKNILAVQKTKILDIDRSNLLKKTGLDLFSLVMDYWAYALHKDKLYKLKVQYDGNVYTDQDKTTFGNAEIDYVDTENKIYTVTPKIGLLMLIKLMLYASNNLDLKISKITYNRVCDFDKDNFQKLIDTAIINDGVSKPVLEAIKENLPTEPELFTTISIFKDFINNAIDLSKIAWVIASNVQNFFTSDAIKRVFGSITKTDSFPLSDDGKEYTIDQLLKQNGIVFPINQYTDIVATMKAMIKTFTGVELDQEDVLLQNMDKYRRIIKKLTSYSLQAMGSAGVIDDITVYYNNPTVLVTKNGFVLTYGLELDGLEYDIARLKAYAWDNPYYLNVNIIELRAKMVINKLKPISGHMVIKDSELRKDGYTYGYSADFETIPSFRLDDYRWYNDWLTVKQAELDALENEITELDGGSIDSSIAPHSNTINLKSAIVEYKKAYGELIVKDGPWLENVTAYGFNTLPSFWDANFKSTDFLSTIGIDLTPVEEVEHMLSTEATETENRVEATKEVKGKLKLVEEATGDMLEKHISFANEATYDFNNKYKVMDITDFVYNTKYVKIGLMAFANGKNNPNELLTYVNKEVANNAPEMVTNKSGALIGARGRKLDIDPIGREDAIGLAMLPYVVTTKKGNTFSSLMYLGLIDTDGNMDVYDCTSIPESNKITFDQVAMCPVVKTVPNVVHGETVVLPSKVSKDKVITVYANLKDNLQLPGSIRATTSLEDSFYPIEPNASAKPNYKHSAGSRVESNLTGLSGGQPTLNENDTMNSILGYFLRHYASPSGVKDNDKRILRLSHWIRDNYKLYIFNSRSFLETNIPYHKRFTLRDHLVKILAYKDTDTVSNQYKWLMINHRYYKLQSDIRFTNYEYPRLGNNKESLAILANCPILYIDMIESTDESEANKLVIVEVDRDYDRPCVNYGVFDRSYSYEEFKAELGEHTDIGNIPRYELAPEFNKLMLTPSATYQELLDKVKDYLGYWEIGKLELVNVGNNLVTGISTTPAKEEILSKYGTDYPWLKFLNIEE